MEHALSPALASGAEEEECPLTFEDLPNDLLGIVYQTLAITDRFNLTRASPSVFRITRGPTALAGALGAVLIHFTADLEKAVRLNPIDPPNLQVSPTHPDFSSHLPSVLQWLKYRVKGASGLSLLIYPPIGDKYGDSEKELVAQAISGLLATLSEASFTGKLSYNVAFNALPPGAPREHFTYLSSAFPTNCKTMSPWISPDDLAPILPVIDFQDIQLMLDFTEDPLPWPADALSKCTRLEKLKLSGNIPDLRLPPLVLRTLRHLDLNLQPFGFDLSGLCPALSSLETLKLAEYPSEDLPRLKALSSLSALQSLKLTISKVIHEVTPSAKIVLPGLKRLSLYLMQTGVLTVDEDGGPRSLAMPLESFNCPSLELLELDGSVIVFAERDTKASLSVDSLEFPKLKFLLVDFLYQVVGDGEFEVDLSKVDFRRNPALAYLSTRVPIKLPPPPQPQALPLPLTQTVEPRRPKFKNGRQEYGDASLGIQLRTDYFSHFILTRKRDLDLSAQFGGQGDG